MLQAYEVLSNSQQCRQYVEELRNAAAESSQGDASSSGAQFTDDFSAGDFSAPTTYSWPCYAGAEPHIHKVQASIPS